MLYVHQNNILSKIDSDYHGKKDQIFEFYKKYLAFREKMESFTFDENHKSDFIEATELINSYRKELNEFAKANKINSQSKFESSLLEEISVYLFKDIPEIKNEKLGVYNKGIYAGLKISSTNEIGFITKDVDFCIGIKTKIRIGSQTPETIILPIVAVEVKTYLDATMFGEVKSSSKSIRSANPNSKTYVLMGYKSIKDEHIIASRQDATLTEMFCLQDGEFDTIHWNVLFEYWKEIKHAIESISEPDTVNKVGRLLFKNK